MRERSELRARRLVQGLTLSQFARLTGFSLAKLYDLELGRLTPTTREQEILDRHLTAALPKCLVCLDSRTIWVWSTTQGSRQPCEACK